MTRSQVARAHVRPHLMWRLEGVRTRTLREVFPKNMETFKGICHEGGVSRAINVFSSSIFTSFTTEGVLTILASLSLLDKPHLGQSSNVRGGQGHDWQTMKVTDQGFPESLALPQVHLGLSRLSTVCTRCSTICTRVDSTSTSRVDCRSILVQQRRGCRRLHEVTSSTSWGWSELPLDPNEQADEIVWC